jgi:glycerophosphoryl diester phosphodiesterase
LRLASYAPGLFVAGRRFVRAAAAQVPLQYGIVPVCDERFVRFAHRLGLVVHVWTIDEEWLMGKLLDIGVDGIMTDRPGVLKGFLERRGLWVP